MADQPQELDGERRLVIQDGNEVAVVEGEQPALRGGSRNCCPRAAVEESDFTEDLVCADEPQHDFRSGRRSKAIDWHPSTWPTALGPSKTRWWFAERQWECLNKTTKPC